MVAALLALAGCSPAEPVENVESGAKKVVTFDGGEVTQGELQEQLDQFAQQSGAGEIKPGSPQYEAAIQQIMPQVVGLEIARAYAEEQNITVSEEDVDQEIETIKDQIYEQAQAAGEQDISREEAFNQALEQAGFTEEELRNDIREQLPLQKVQERVAGDAQPTQAEIEAYYEENKELQFTTSEQRCVSHILFNKDQEQKAEEVKQQLEDGGDFAELAREFSQDPGSKEEGGDLGCQGRGSFVPAFEDAAFGAEEGEIVGPVETRFGYHVIQVNEIQAEEAAPLEEVRPEIREQLAQQEQMTEFERWIEEQKEQRNVKYLPGYDPDQPTPGSTTQEP
ncbi:MAG: peptidylprolyl isomerase [Actinomycetota bacterium]|nr:peptidylprolyl isomerase [Actinomycetota bacterium]